MIVKVKRAKANNWLGILNYVGADTKIGPELDRFGQPVTGLTQEEEKQFEKELQLPDGALRRTSDFWDKFFVSVGNTTLELDTSVPEHNMWYKFLKAQRKVAKSISELRTNARALIVIFSEEEEAKKENKRSKDKRMAYRIFDEMSTADMKQVLLLFNSRASTSVSDEVVENTLGKLVDEDPRKFLDIVQDEKLKLKVFISELLLYGVLGKNGPAYTLNGEVLSPDLENLVYYLEAKENQSVYKSLKDQLARAKK